MQKKTKKNWNNWPVNWFTQYGVTVLGTTVRLESKAHNETYTAVLIVVLL